MTDRRLAETNRVTGLAVGVDQRRPLVPSVLVVR